MMALVCLCEYAEKKEELKQPAGPLVEAEVEVEWVAQELYPDA